MDTSRERDQSVERLLRQSLKAPRPADATELCLDAETLAAWVDGGLTSAALEMAQSHVADCERCQSLVGAMARANAAIPLLEPERTSRPWLAWLVPVTAVAAALTVWVSVPRDKYVSVAAPPPVADVQTEPRKEAAQNPALEAAAPAEAPKASSSVARQSAPAAGPAAAPELRKDSARLEADTLKEEQKIAPLAAPPAAPAVVGGIAAAPPPPARAAAAAEAVTDRARSANGVSQPAQACSPGWSAAPTDLAAQLTAGASPTSSVCWLVGRGGVVIVSIDDGRTWRRVTFPEITDLSGVQSTGARAATVATADGRIFSTSDGGGTWIRR